jgi:hypothetical protein
MGKMIATCGHEIGLRWFHDKDSVIHIKEFSREGQRAVSQMVVCPRCRKFYGKHRLILEDTKAEREWLKQRRPSKKGVSDAPYGTSTSVKTD